MVYDYLPLDLFVFVEGEEGVSEAVRSPAFNVTLTKVRQPAEKKAADDRNAASEMHVGGLGLTLVAVATFMSLF